MTSDYILLTGTSNTKLAKKIALSLKKEVYEPVKRFADGEIRVIIPTSVRGKHVFVIQSTSPPCVNDYFMELLLLIDAAKRASASEITAIIPYFGYARQDRKEIPRVPISSSVVARTLENAGTDRIITIDIHSEQQQGFVQCPWDNLYSSYALLPVLAKTGVKNLVIGSPDKNGVARATAFAQSLSADGVAIAYKERDLKVNNQSSAIEMIGDVSGKLVILVDDIIDTAGTVCEAAELMLKRGAKKVIAAAAHGLFSAPALERIKKSSIEKVYVTDTVRPTSEVEKNKKIKVVSVSPLLSSAIKRIASGKSLSEALLDF